jgi:hypothetical protein
MCTIVYVAHPDLVEEARNQIAQCQVVESTHIFSGQKHTRLFITLRGPNPRRFTATALTRFPGLIALEDEGHLYL